MYVVFKVYNQHSFVGTLILCRGKSGERLNLVSAQNIQKTSFTGKSEFKMMTTGDGFHLKSGFKKI